MCLSFDVMIYGFKAALDLFGHMWAEKNYICCIIGLNNVKMMSIANGCLFTHVHRLVANCVCMLFGAGTVRSGLSGLSTNYLISFLLKTVNR